MNYLLDTCLISELIRRLPNKNVINWIDTIDEEKLYLSVITIGELEKGVNKLDPSKRRDTITEWLHEDLIIRFNDRILSLDLEILIEWGRLTAMLENRGLKMPSIDSLIAATARQYNLCLVTRNERDFQHCNIELINPWK